VPPPARARARAIRRAPSRRARRGAVETRDGADARRRRRRRRHDVGVAASRARVRGDARARDSDSASPLTVES
jgi:hypothetical protein